MGVISCPHCGLNVVPKGKMCPACRSDVTDLRNAASNLKQAQLQRVIGELITAGKSRPVIRQFLIEELGLTPDQVEEGLERAHLHYQSASEVRGPRDIFIGLLWFGGGATVTVVTFTFAELHGGTWVLAYGPVIYGAVRLLIGVQRFFNARRRIRLRHHEA